MRSTMAPRNLLRHIFRHGPHLKSKSAASPPKTSEPHQAEPTPSANNAVEASSPTSHPPHATQHPVLEDIAEETQDDSISIAEATQLPSPSITDTPTSFDHESISQAPSPPAEPHELSLVNHELTTFNTRELIHATIDEARIATHAHLDTINTTLALLDALEGFSPTIPVVREEMELSQRVCEQRLRMLGEAEEAVGRMGWDDEGGSVEGEGGGGVGADA